MKRCYAVILAALAIGIPGLASALGGQSPPQRWEAEEDQAVLFGNEAVDATAPGPDAAAEAAALRETLKGWVLAANQAGDDATSKATSDGLMALSLTAFQAYVASVQITLGGNRICSTSNPGDTNCTVNTNVGTGDSGEQQCSTTAVASNNTDCSVTVTGITTGDNNTTCSAIGGAAGTQSSCSSTTNTNGNATTVTCSSSGGTSSNSGDGASACSASTTTKAGGNQNNYCSTNGSVKGGATCSTYSGEHQACSAGLTDNTQDKSTCSTSNTGGTNADKCSVTKGGGPAGKNGNKCTAIATEPGQTAGQATCSVSVPSGGTTNDSCSVTKGTANAMCTTTFAGGATESSTFQCSAFTAGGQTKATGNCSVLNPDGSLDSGPPSSGAQKNKCGDPNFIDHW